MICLLYPQKGSGLLHTLCSLQGNTQNLVGQATLTLVVELSLSTSKIDDV